MTCTTECTQFDLAMELFLEDHRKSAQDLAYWAEKAISEGFPVFSVPIAGHRKKFRTVDMVERVNKEIKRRTRVATIFPILNLAYA